MTILAGGILSDRRATSTNSRDLPSSGATIPNLSLAGQAGIVLAQVCPITAWRRRLAVHRVILQKTASCFSFISGITQRCLLKQPGLVVELIP